MLKINLMIHGLAVFALWAVYAYASNLEDSLTESNRALTVTTVELTTCNRTVKQAKSDIIKLATQSEQHQRQRQEAVKERDHERLQRQTLTEQARSRARVILGMEDCADTAMPADISGMLDNAIANQ